ncbi:exodeoxyribonuclease VII small subunit [Pararobbsia silviterrae]|uniref:Exodeoxyribonuclease 7 small subunit n=1 Tax=Pararobbsia silviterrae TaxID=1792498 RepID=A0A494Y166_9BURK|nr:exodeoxyribonuclease VII small subunit [Pararobbsia silviterrae]RKP56512.1 exodeoxyribonuclease VII small subunit [Pararobbsia silviterrae]
MANTATPNRSEAPAGTGIGASAATPTTGEQPVSYEAAVAELETLVAQMEGGALSLEDSLSAYRRGSQLVSFCQQQLEKVEQQVRVLDGEVLKPLATDEDDA